MRRKTTVVLKILGRPTNLGLQAGVIVEGKPANAVAITSSSALSSGGCTIATWADTGILKKFLVSKGSVKVSCLCAALNPSQKTCISWKPETIPSAARKCVRFRGKGKASPDLLLCGRDDH